MIVEGKALVILVLVVTMTVNVWCWMSCFHLS